MSVKAWWRADGEHRNGWIRWTLKRLFNPIKKVEELGVALFFM